MAEAEHRRSTPGHQCICDVDDEWAIDGSQGGNGTQYINHSCEPNSYVIVSSGRIFIYAFKEIAAGEEITTDYLFELYSDQTACSCQTVACDETTRLSPAAGSQTPHYHSAPWQEEKPVRVKEPSSLAIERAEQSVNQAERDAIF